MKYRVTTAAAHRIASELTNMAPIEIYRDVWSYFHYCLPTPSPSWNICCLFGSHCPYLSLNKYTVIHIGQISRRKLPNDILGSAKRLFKNGWYCYKWLYLLLKLLEPSPYLEELIAYRYVYL